MVDVPDATKCCLCLPLRRGLLAWVYFKLAVLLSVTLGVLIPLTVLLSFYATYVDDIIFCLLILAYALMGIEIVFEFIFVISAHRKKYKYLKLYYQYEIVMLCCEIVLSVFFSWYVFESPGVMFGGLFLILILLALNIYFIYLVRSEVRKLELSAQFTFKNLTNDPECSIEILDPN